MKRCLILALMFCVVSVGAGAATCVGGKEYEGKNGHTYCISNRGMNWWSAFQWCEAQERHLATPSEACDYDGTSWGGGLCENLRLGEGVLWRSQFGWLAMSKSEETAYAFLFIASADIASHKKTTMQPAVCY